MGVVTRSDAMDFAESVRKIVDALIAEGFTEADAIELTKIVCGKSFGR